MAFLPTVLITRKQDEFDAAAVVAIESHDTEPMLLPAQAKLSVNDKAIITKYIDLFDFKLWSGLPRVWITYCFGPELAEDLINDGRIKLEPGPVDDRPRLELTDFDVQIAEAAGFHRAMNIWNKLAYYGNGEEVKNTLHEQVTTLARLLDSCDIEDSSSLPGKFKDFATLRCPHPFTSGDLMSSVPQSSYYDEFLNILNRH